MHVFFRGFFKTFKDKWRFFRILEAFDYRCEALIKITRLFEDIFREMDGGFNKNNSREVEVFLNKNEIL
jgi:hypothetical protein